MIQPVRSRATFEQFRRARSGRSGPVRVRVLRDVGTAAHGSPADAGSPIADVFVAYALPRRTGGAVVRNRIRRRLRSVVAELHRDGSTLLPGGAALLFGAGPEAAELPYPQLRSSVEGALARATQPSR